MAPKLPSLSEVIEKFELHPSRKLGQNFLRDPAILSRIAAGCGALKHKNVIEIGPGPGGLTRALLAQPLEKIWGVEYDERAVHALQETLVLADPRLTVIHQDALKYDLREIIGKPCWLVGNLPYNIATALLLNWLAYFDQFEGAVLMFQKEVADRLVARPDTKAYGRLSVLVQSCAVVHKLFDIAPGAFWPAPKVTSSVVHFMPRTPYPEPWQQESLAQITAWAFGQRRKMLRSSLVPHLINGEEVLQKVGIEPTQRAETVSWETYQQLVHLLHKTKF